MLSFIDVYIIKIIININNIRCITGIGMVYNKLFAVHQYDFDIRDPLTVRES